MRYEDVRRNANGLCEHIATKYTWFFPTDVFFLVYLDGRVRSFENMFEGRNLKGFEFALSNPFMGLKKTALLEKNPQLAVGNQSRLLGPNESNRKSTGELCSQIFPTRIFAKSVSVCTLQILERNASAFFT